MFAIDLSGRQDLMPRLRRPEGLRFVRQGFQPKKYPSITNAPFWNQPLEREMNKKKRVQSLFGWICCR
jgi:hypothetical protein